MVTYNDVIKQTLVLLQQNRSEWENRIKGTLLKSGIMQISILK